MLTAIERLQLRFSELADPDIHPNFHARIAILDVGGLLHIDFRGTPFSDAFNELCSALVRPNVASVLGSLYLKSPDEGANGTCNWDLSFLVAAEVSFPRLRSFTVAQNEPGAHNRIIVAEDHDEAGVLGLLLHKAPALDTLVVPSAPDSTFFSVDHLALRYLDVDAGYDTQGFIANLADNSCFPALQAMAFGEFNETYLDDYPAGCTPFEDYRRVLLAPHFPSVRSFVWRNPACSSDQIAELRALRPKRDLQIHIVRFSDAYV